MSRKTKTRNDDHEEYWANCKCPETQIGRADKGSQEFISDQLKKVNKEMVLEAFNKGRGEMSEKVLGWRYL